MRNCKKELLTALVAKIKTQLPTMTVRTKLNDFDTSDNSAYPYIYIGDVFQSENGAKNFFQYPVEVLIHVVYKDLSSLLALYTSQNAVLGIFTVPECLTLTNDFQVMETTLLSSNDSEIKIDSGTLNIGLIRVNFLILDKFNI